MAGAYSPFLSLYFVSVGMSIAQVGMLVALPPLIRIVGPPFWGALADRLGRRVALLRVSAAAGLVMAGLIAAAGGRYEALLLLLAGFHFALSAQGPLAETLALAAAGGDAGRYGAMRLWGSLGFIGALSVSGRLLDAVGVGRLPWVMAALCALLFVVTWRVPEAPARVSKSAPALWPRLREPAIAAFFASCILMQVAHAALYGFYSLYLDSFGYSKTQIGLIWTIGVVAEIVVFRVQRRLFSRFSPLTLLSFSMAVAAGRFLLIAWDGGGLVIIFITQLMHAVTFGVHHSAAMAMLHRWFGHEQQGRAQGLYATMGFGVGGALGGLAAGWMWVNAGPPAAYLGAAGAAALAWGAIALCRRFEYAANRASAG